MPESTSSSRTSPPPPPFPKDLSPKDFQVNNRGDGLFNKLKDKKDDWREARARKLAQRPPRTGPQNANPPVFVSTSPLAVLFTNNFGFSQGCMLSNSQLRVTGMGGWDAQGLIPASLNDEIALAMDNVERTLREMRYGCGWDFVYVVRTSHTDLVESAELMAAHLQARMQRHRPMWSCVEVRRLKVDGMRVEVEVEAYLEKQDAAV